MQTVFDVYSDPGHGWVKVPLKLLEELEIRDKITPYSYRRGNFGFLEEDCDAPRFVAAMKARGVTVKFRSHIGDRLSRIRSYDRFEGVN
jgi:hypothetical protein